MRNITYVIQQSLPYNRSSIYNDSRKFAGDYDKGYNLRRRVARLWFLNSFTYDIIRNL